MGWSSMGSRTLAARWSAGCPGRPRRRPRWTRAAQPQVPDGGRVAGGDHHGDHGDTEPEGDQLDQEGVAVERPERRSRPRPDGPASITHAPGPSNACGKSPASRVVLSPRRATKRTVSGETIQWPTRMQIWLERSLVAVGASWPVTGPGRAAVGHRWSRLHGGRAADAESFAACSTGGPRNSWTVLAKHLDRGGVHKRAFLRQPPLPRRQGRYRCPELVSEINVAQPGLS